MAKGDRHTYVAFAETSKEVENILSGLSSNGISSNGVLWVALEGEADISLRQKGIEPALPSDMISFDERKRIFLDASHWSNHWLDMLPVDNNAIIFEKKSSLSDIVRSGMHLYFSHVFRLITVVEKTIDKLGPNTLIFSAPMPEIVQGLGINGEYYLNRIGNAVCNKRNVKALNISKEHFVSFKKRNAQMGFSFFYNKINRALFKMLSYYSSSCFSLSLDDRTKNALYKRNVLVAGGGMASPFWRLESICNFLKKQTKCSLVPIYYAKDHYDRSKNGLFLSIEKEKSETSPEFLRLKEKIDTVLEKGKLLDGCVYNGIDISGLCNQKLSWVLRTYLPAYWSDYLSINRILKTAKFDLLIGAAYSSNDTSLISALHCFKNNKIPTLLISHGIQYRIYGDGDEVHKAFDTLFSCDYSHVAAVGEYLNENSGNFSEKKVDIRCTGSIWYQKMRNISNLRKFVLCVLLGISPFRKKIVYFSTRAAREYYADYLNINFDETCKSICDIAKVAEKLKCQFIIKSHPMLQNADLWVKSFIKKAKYNLVLSKDANPLLLSTADMVVVPKTLMTIKALDYGRPTLLYGHYEEEFIPFEEMAASINTYGQKTNKPFIRATGYNELLQAANKILFDEETLKSIEERNRLSDPRVHHNSDGRQVIRIAEFMADIIEHNA